jgi:hypothetical protein
MRQLRPFFGYFGSKWKLARVYPDPAHELLIEPFAGSAGYSLRYPTKNVVLIEKNPRIAELWKYLIRVPEQTILALPDTLDACACDAERTLIGMWWAKAPTAPRTSQSSWCRNPVYAGSSWWGPKIRERIANQLSAIRHWTCHCMSYQDLPDDITATWFVDPPYQIAGSSYPCGPRDIDYTALGVWCKSRRGQTIVCEAVGASWLPFAALHCIKTRRINSKSKHQEAIWVSESR